MVDPWDVDWTIDLRGRVAVCEDSWRARSNKKF